MSLVYRNFILTEEFDFPDDFDFADDTRFINGNLLFDDTLPPDHRSGFVAVIGRPNVGKSTLMNHYLGQKIAIVSPKPQTTRNQLLGILTLPHPGQPELSEVCPPAQIIFIDTPGIHRPHHKLGEYLVETAKNALPEADVIVWLADVSRPPGLEEQLVAAALTAVQKQAVAAGETAAPVILALNKIDLLTPAELEAIEQNYLALHPAADWLPISAAHGDNCVELLRRITASLPLGPRYYPAEQVTDQQERFIAAELIREAALHTLREEVPHALAVVVTDFTRRNDDLIYIGANLILERQSHKQIVIGEKGSGLKKIGQRARPQIEQMVGARVYLELWVKVRPKWRSNNNELKWLGYSAQ